jgi:hypothetical protein
MADMTPPAGLLRPLGFGEIFDRAVTLYVRNFVPFSLIVLIVMIPNAIYQFLMAPQQLEQISTMLKGPLGAQHAADPLAMYKDGSFGWALLMIFVFFLILPFGLNAVALGVARLYTGAAVDIGACYARAFKRFWPVIGTLVMELLILGGTYFGLVIVMMIAGAIAVAMGMLGKFFLVVGIIVAAAIGLAMIALLIVMAIAMSFAMFAVVIEDRPVFDAIGDGFRRVFARSEVGRALLFALATGLIGLVNIIVAYAFVALAIWLDKPWLVSLEQVVVSTAFYAFNTVLFAVYYYDVRIRREGLDMETQLESLVPVPSA